jgi:hypothetical protein
MRFGNSSDYFGLGSNVPRQMALNSATGKAFHGALAAVSGPLTAFVQSAGCSAANSAVAI